MSKVSSEADGFEDQPALLTAFLRMSSGCGWGERINSIAEEWTRLLKDQLDC